MYTLIATDLWPETQGSKIKPDFHSTIASRRQNFPEQNKRNESKHEIFVPDQQNCRIWWSFTQQVLVKEF